MKIVKTNAVRLLEAAKIPCEEKFYDVSDGRIDALAIAEKIGESPEQVFKTLVTYSNKKEYFVFVVPAAAELDLKKAAAAAKSRHAARKMQVLYPQSKIIFTGCAADVDTDTKLVVNVAQHSSLPQGPIPPIRPASCRAPICVISILTLNTSARTFMS